MNKPIVPDANTSTISNKLEVGALDRADKPVKMIAVGLSMAKVHALNSLTPPSVAQSLIPAVLNTGVPATACH